MEKLVKGVKNFGVIFLDLIFVLVGVLAPLGGMLVISLSGEPVIGVVENVISCLVFGSVVEFGWSGDRDKGGES